jgi:hypothetical protein
MRSLIWVLLAVFIMTVSCDNQGPKEKKAVAVKKEYVPIEINPDRIIHIALNDSVSRTFQERGRKIAAKAKVALKRELKNAIREGGLEHAVEFCHTRAMEITDSISLAENVIIKRVAKKNRNPYNAMNDTVANIYKGFAINHMNNQPMKSVVTWDVQGRPVYFNPIIVEAACLNCHGTVGQEVNPDLAAKIAALYPEDKATGFKLKDLRGMWEITFPEYIVVRAE